jgi:alpha/beta hydrolase family protein
VDVPDVSDARSGEVSIAYQAVGEGPPDLVLLPFLANIYTLWHAPGFARIGRRLATGRRLIVVNPRGVGLSDRPRGFTIDSRLDDVRAVIDDLGVERVALIGLAESAASCAAFAASYPDRVERQPARPSRAGAVPRRRARHGGRRVLRQLRRAGARDRLCPRDRGTVKDLAAGSGIRFADRGPRELNGIPGEWRIYSVVDD